RVFASRDPLRRPKLNALLPLPLEDDCGRDSRADRPPI
ncbi:hypothetical protein C6341_g26054, partial [Phytophthora cactorum]